MVFNMVLRREDICRIENGKQADIAIEVVRVYVIRVIKCVISCCCAGGVSMLFRGSDSDDR